MYQLPAIIGVLFTVVKSCVIVIVLFVAVVQFIKIVSSIGGLLGGARDDERRAHEQRHRWENKRAREDRYQNRRRDRR